MKWAEKHGVTIQHIQPGQPQQNAYIERYNRTVRHEWLDQTIIETIEEAQDHATKWLWTYNNDRPNMGIGGITPAMKLKMAAYVLRMHPVKNGGITQTCYFWRALDHHGEVLESFLTKCRNRAAALQFLKKTMKWHVRPEGMVTDRLQSNGAALKEIELTN